MPSFIATGNRIGAMISTIDEGSITLPASSSTTLTNSRNAIDAEALVEHPRGELLRDLLGGHQVAEHHRVGDDVEQHRAHVGRVEQHLRHLRERHVLVDEHRDEERVDGAHRRRLGRREDAGVDAADDDDDRAAGPRCSRGTSRQRSPQRRLRLARVVVLARAPPGREAEQRREHEAGDDAGDEQRADRRVGRDRVHHHHDRRRDQDAERAGGRDDAGAEARAGSPA